MTEFMVVYLGGDKPSTPEEGKKHFADYQAWLGGLGDAVVSAMNPIKDTKTINPDGSISESVTGMSGYTILKAENIDIAIEMAQACPFLKINGQLEVSEMVQMPS